MPRWAAATGGAVASVLAVLVGLLAGYGWLYLLRGLGWFSGGPGVGDALPLLQLAGFDRQPLARVVVAWLLAGLIAGVALLRVSPLHRVALVAPLSLLLLLLASQAAYAVARNLKLGDVVLNRRPGFGPVLEALVFAVGCVVPRSLSHGYRWRRPSLDSVKALSGLRHSPLRGGEHRDAAEHHADREQVSDNRDGPGA
jgi:hypothetical protein